MSTRTECPHLHCAEHVRESCMCSMPHTSHVECHLHPSKRTLHQAFTSRRICPRMLHLLNAPHLPRKMTTLQTLHISTQTHEARQRQANPIRRQAILPGFGASHFLKTLRSNQRMHDLIATHQNPLQTSLSSMQHAVHLIHGGEMNLIGSQSKSLQPISISGAAQTFRHETITLKDPKFGRHICRISSCLCHHQDPFHPGKD